MAAALRRASNATAAAVDSLNGGGVFERHRCGLRRHAGETRGVLRGGVFDGLDG
jgi:hypothetical protein